MPQEEEKENSFKSENLKIAKEDQKSELEKHRQAVASFQRQSMVLSLQIAFILGIPALLAVLIGKKLDAIEQTGRLYTLSFLAIAFIGSWVLIIIKYNKLNNKIKQAQEKFKNQNTD